MSLCEIAIICDRQYQKCLSKVIGREFINWFFFLNYPTLDYNFKTNWRKLPISVIKDWCKQKSKESRIPFSLFQPRILALISKNFKCSLFSLQRRPRCYNSFRPLLYNPLGNLASLDSKASVQLQGTYIIAKIDK